MIDNSQKMSSLAISESSKKKRGSKSKRRSKESPSDKSSEPRMSSEVTGEANGVVNNSDDMTDGERREREGGW